MQLLMDFFQKMLSLKKAMHLLAKQERLYFKRRKSKQWVCSVQDRQPPSEDKDTHPSHIQRDPKQEANENRAYE
jgi:hypothetical protein